MDATAVAEGWTWMHVAAVLIAVAIVFGGVVWFRMRRTQGPRPEDKP